MTTSNQPTPAQVRRRDKAVARVERLWRINVQDKEIIFDPRGSKWFVRSNKLFLRRRTDVRHLYIWQHSWAATSVGMAFTQPIEHDTTWGFREGPRKMWMTDDWSIPWIDRRHLKSSQPRPHVAMLLTNSSQGAAIMVRPWTRREQFLAFLAGTIAVSGSVFSTLAYFNITP